MNFDSYRTIAEISVALTGFIGVVIVLQHRDKPFSRLGLTTILATSLGATSTVRRSPDLTGPDCTSDLLRGPHQVHSRRGCRPSISKPELAASLIA